MSASVSVPAHGQAEAGGFRRVLGLGALLSVAIGLVVSQGVMVLMLQGAGFSGLGFIVPLGLAYLLALSYACSFSELSLMIPRAGGLSSYTEVALGHFPAILATFSGYVVVAMFALSAELLLLDLIVGKIYPGVFPPFSIAFGVLGLFTILNLMGIDIFAKLQTALAVVMVFVLLLLGIAAIVEGAPSDTASTVIQGDWNPMGAGVLTLTALAVWGFVGAEFVCPLVEETKRPERNIPRSMMIGLTVIFLTIGLYCLGALFMVPQEALTTDALPHYLFATKVFGKAGELFLVIASVTATFSTLNSSLASIPRMLYGMAQNGQAFPIFKRLSPRARTPWVSVLFVSAITGLPILVLGQDAASVNLLLLAAALAWLLAYIIVHLDVIALRRRYPAIARPFKTPFYPLPQLFGIAGMLYAIWYASPSPDMTGKIFGIAGVVLGLVSVIALVWIKVVMRKDLFRPEALEGTH
ncbi:APC family permease [Metapseudomonas lalkuanensis]|uniref:APC family permease n=1 Tax=Metapseudomonas lalkuanensis TaxID=2604832 RepID=A0A5J6QNJ6_9GAMM|nr:APC family permease [Pseudomonas lalkuanensis]QEY62179.1 APC family permease [Pseudomonas lalkuanensis]UCO99965.1 APC family permease [Pseudomonas lalkuanensis]